MPDPARLRDSTQIVLPEGALEGLREDLDEEFRVTIVEQDGVVQIVASPVVITEVTTWLARRGLSLP